MQYIARFFQVVIIDILLSGDNALVIALACRGLPQKLINRGLLMGTMGAIIARFSIIFFATGLLEMPFVRIVGAALLFWIGVKLLLPAGDGAKEVKTSARLMGAVWAVITADLVMSLDNVVAVAAAVDGDPLWAAAGIAFSIPCIIWGSKLLLTYIERFPIIVTAGGAMLGWIAGGMWMQDAWLDLSFSDVVTVAIKSLGAVSVWWCAWMWQRLFPVATGIAQ